MSTLIYYEETLSKLEKLYHQMLKDMAALDNQVCQNYGQKVTSPAAPVIKVYGHYFAIVVVVDVIEEAMQEGEAIFTDKYAVQDLW